MFKMIRHDILMAYLIRVSESMWQLSSRYSLDFLGNRDNLSRQNMKNIAPMKSPTLIVPTIRLRMWVRIPKSDRSINSDADSISNMLYLQSDHSQQQLMNLIMLEEQRSFENKMDNINQTNQLLDELQKKMNSYFNQHSSHKSSQPILLADDQEFKSSALKFKIYNEPQPRISQPTIQNKPKKSDSFRLFAKSKPKNQPQFEQKFMHKQMSDKQPCNMRPQIQQNSPHQHSPKLKLYPKQDPKIKDQEFPQARTRNNSLVREMETMEILMKQKMLAKQRRIRQLEQQIITQNQQRVYLYKVNVRLEQELKFLQEVPKQNDRCQWQICKMNDDIERLKKELQKRKKERKQLKREEQTLKDGYRTIVQNRRDITMKQLERYGNSQKQSKQSYQMLKSLMGQLDKLKGVVEQKIKEKSRRKVIKSFKH